MNFSNSITLRNISFKYSPNAPFVFNNLNLSIKKGTKAGFMGVTGSGKSTLIDIVMALLIPTEGTLVVDETIIDDSNFRSWQKNIAHVPQSIYLTDSSVAENIAFGVRLYEKLSRSEMDERVEWALNKAALWTEAKDKLNQSGLSLSGGQQQRLCIARGVAVKPSVILLDEPTSALDPISTGKIEELINELKHEYTIAIVTHNMQQAARVSDYTAYMYLGSLVEYGKTDEIFIKPKRKETEDYITGRFG
jgi:phosphate transport system ATP-binding protein